jgi:hypothetical protein
MQRNLKDMNNSFTKNLLISTLLWIIFAVLTDDWLEKLLLFAIFLAIPLLLFLVPTNKRYGIGSRYHTLLLKYHPYMAATIGLAFVFPTGWISGTLSIIWAFYLLALSGYGVRRIMERGWYILEENAIDVGFLYAILGGIWLSIYCFIGGFAPYPRQIVLLTAIHFHYAAIFAPVFMGLVGRMLAVDQKTGTLYRWSTYGMMISPLLVAIGISVGHWLETLAVLLFAACLFIYSYFVLVYISKQVKNAIIRIGLQISAVIIVLTILLSIIYSFGLLFGTNWLTIDQMLGFHGVSNALGFVILGLLCWLCLNPKENTILYGLPNIQISGDKKIGKDFFVRNGLVSQSQRHVGLIDNIEKFTRIDFLPKEIHPKIRSFYENTILYDLTAQTTWHRGFHIFSKLYKRWSSQIEQIDLPTNNDAVIRIDAKIIGIHNKQLTHKKLRAWIRSNKATGKAMFVAVYTDYQANNENYLHITLPIPKSNITGILRLEHGPYLSLQLTSLPRKGRTGDEGIYLMLKNFSIRLPINEHFLIWVDEFGRLQATHRIWMFGLKMVSIEYEISGK